MSSALQSIACENSDENLWYALAMSIPRTIFGYSSSDSLIVYIWVCIILLYLLLSFVVPICFLNSSNNIRSPYVVFVSTLSIVVVLVFIIILWYRPYACKQSRLKGGIASYLGTRNSEYKIPKGLSSAIERSYNNYLIEHSKYSKSKFDK